MIHLASLYDRAMCATTEAEATEIFAQCVYGIMKEKGVFEEQAVQLAKENIGYYSGYFSDGTRRRVERLFHCIHPFLGSVDGHKYTATQMLEMGKAWAEGKLEKFVQPDRRP